MTLRRYVPALCLSTLAAVLAPAVALAVPFTVNTTNYTAPAVGTTGGLKAAVAYANTHAGTTIQFQIPTSDPGYVAAGGYFRIAPPSTEYGIPLAVTMSGTIIDASTQASFTGNTNAAGPEIYLDGFSATHPADPNPANWGNDGFVLSNVQNVVLRGFVIGRCNHGITVVGGGYNTIDGNFIGVAPSGTSTVGNLQSGVRLDNTIDNLVGAYNGSQPNVIGGNKHHGVLMTNNAWYNIIQVNYIGTNAAGAAGLGNLGNGVRFDLGAHDNNVGGNVIANNGSSNVLAFITAGTVNGVRNNSIYNGGCLAFRVQAAPANGQCFITANDNLDPDTGPNNQQNHPVLTNAVYSGGTTYVTGSVNTTANTNIIVDFYASPGPNALGQYEGRTVLGWITGTTDASGNFTFTSTPFNTNVFGQYVTASATRWVGAGMYETGEYSTAVQVH
ncbi:MAG: hypothetical protein U0326_13365 [Polyangiales bacterium]